MIAALITGIAARTGLGRTAVKLIGCGLIVLAIVIGWACVKRDIIATHEARQEAAVTRADRKADAAAGVQRRADDARTRTEINALERMKPDAPFAPVSAAEQRRFDCIRLQQQARRQHRQPPACN